MKECQYCGADEGEFHEPLCPVTQFRQAQNAYVEPTNAAKDTIIARLTRERDEARAEVERLRTMPQAAWVRLLADAKRYRTIRRMIRDGIPPFDNDWYDESELDAAIDAAREGE